MAVEFEVNLEGIQILINGNDASSYAESEQIHDNIFIDKNADGEIIGLEVFGPLKVSTEKSPMRVAHRMMQQEALDEEEGNDRDDAVKSETAHRTAAEGGSYTARQRGLRGEGGSNAGQNRVESGMVVNPNMHSDSAADVVDSNARDNANNSVGRHGIAQNAPATSVDGETDHANPEEVADPERTGQSMPAVAEAESGDSKNATKAAKKSEKQEAKRLDESTDATETSGDAQGNNSATAALSEANSEEEQRVREEAGIQQDDANSGEAAARRTAKENKK